MKTIVLPVSSCSRHDLVLHVAADQRVERAERLVVEHHLRVDGERTGDADALLHAAGELVGELVAPRPRARPAAASRRARASRSAFGTPCTSSPKATLSITRRCASRPKCWKTIDTDVRRSSRSSARPAPVTSWPAISDRSGGRLDQPDQRADERRLARPRQAHDHEHLAGPDLERHVADGGDAARLLAQLAAREVGVRACR